MSVVIAPGKVVTLTYILTDEEGHVLEERSLENPVVYLHGRDQILHMLERTFEGQTPGFAAVVSVDAANGFGVYNQDLVMELSNDNFPPNMKVQPGMKFNTIGPNGLPTVVRVLEVREDGVLIDGNHPLAGMPLIFDCRVIKVRDATERELATGEIEDLDGGSDPNDRTDLH